MFVVSIFGGLGSQMDQYSFLLALKKAYPDTIVKIEINNLFEPQHNGFELKRVFGINEPEASIAEVELLSEFCPRTTNHFKIKQYLYKLRRLMVGQKESWIYPEDPTAFYPQVFALNPFKNYIFFGNWGNERYRVDVEQEIKNTFHFQDFNNSRNSSIAHDILSSNSVSIHVRHGDYVTIGYSVLPMSYYREAIKIVKGKIDSPRFFIFSDDTEFIKSEFDFLDNKVIVDWNKGDDSFRDMQLMSLCKHNIIANSTFSYWGARLNYYEQSIKIAPKYHVPICKHFIGEGNDKWLLIDNQK